MLYVTVNVIVLSLSIHTSGSIHLYRRVHTSTSLFCKALSNLEEEFILFYNSYLIFHSTQKNIHKIYNYNKPTCFIEWSNDGIWWGETTTHFALDVMWLNLFVSIRLQNRWKCTVLFIVWLRRRLSFVLWFCWMTLSPPRRLVTSPFGPICDSCGMSSTRQCCSPNGCAIPPDTWRNCRLPVALSPKIPRKRESH